MADVPMNVEGLLQSQENGGEGASSYATSSSGPSAPKGEEDDILDRLGIKHVEESVASKDIISKAQARWAAAAERAQKAAVKSKVRKSSSSSTTKGGANGEDGEAAETAKASSSSSKKGSDADLDTEEAKGGGETPSSTKKSSFSAAVAEGKKKQQNGDGIDDGFDTEGEADNSDNDDGVQRRKGNRKVIKEVLVDESYQVRIGDLTPFEEQELAAEKKKEKKKARPVAAAGVGASAGSMANRGEGAGGPGTSASSALGRNSAPSSSATTSLLPPLSQGTSVGPPRDGIKSRLGIKKAGGGGMAKEETIPKKMKRPLPNAAASSATSAAAPSATALHALDGDSADSKPRSRIKESSSKQKASASSKERSRPMRSSSGGGGGGEAAPSVRGSSSAMASQPSSVECPVCGRQVPVKDKERPDAELSEHLDRCMRRGGRAAPASPIFMDESNDDEAEEEEGGSRAFVRRSTRKRRQVLDVGDDSEESEDDEGREERKRCSDSCTTRAPVKRDPDMDFIDEESNDEEDDEEEDMEGLVHEGEDEEEGEDDDRKPAAAGRGKKRGSFAAAAAKEKKRLAAAAAAAGGKQRARGQLLIDDFAEDDYQRRLAEYEEALGTQSDDEEDEDRNLTQARHEGLAPNEAEAGPLELPGGFTLSARINRRLYWYQRTGVRWLWELYRQGAGGILGDEMGLGKTVQLAAFLGGLRRSGNLRSALIVAPATLMSQWANEIFAWAPRLRVVILHRSAAAFTAQPVHKISRFVKRAMASEGVVCITTYESLKLLRHELLMHQWSYVAMDEGQKIRNPDAEITVCAKQLPTVHRIILSGTPIQNNLRELWSLFDFCFPGRLGTLPAFETELATPIRIGGYSNATPTQAQLAYRCALVLRDLIHPYLLRRMKKDIMQILPMPKKTEQVLFCKLTQRQRNIYRAALLSPEIRLILDRKASHFRAITILRKICNHADLAADPTSDGYDIMGAGYEREWDLGGDEEDEEEEEDGGIASSIMKREGPTRTTASNDYGGVSRSGKLQVLAEILPRWEIQGHRVLLFSQTRQMLNILERMVKQNGWRYLRMDGNTSIGSRPALIDRFNNDESIFCFLLTTRTGGLGISLTGADRVILYDPDWNPQTDIQARERAWRLGQKRPVTIYRLVTTGTIEEKIYQRQIFKTAITNRVLQDPKQKRLFSSGELKELFTLKDDFHDEDAPNDTADIFMEGVVKRSSLPKRRRKQERKRSRPDRGDLDDGVDGEGGVVGGASSAIVAIEEDRRAVARDTRHHELEGSREEGGEGEADGDEGERRRMEGLGRVGKEEVHQQEDDDCKILKAVFNGKGIASVLSHDVVEEGKKNMDLWIQMQDQAKRIAERAARVLRESSADVQATQASTGNRFTPTWTGRTGALPTARFGPRSTTATAGGSIGGEGGGAAGSASTNNPTTVFGLGQRTATSSTDILSRFREREGVSEGTSTAVGSPSSSAAHNSNGGGGAGGGTSVEEAHYVSLLERIKRFLREKGPRVPTAQLLQNFRNVPNSDAVIFKTMLKEVAILSRGAWTLKEDV